MRSHNINFYGEIWKINNLGITMEKYAKNNNLGITVLKIVIFK